MTSSQRTRVRYSYGRRKIMLTTFRLMLRVSDRQLFTFHATRSEPKLPDLTHSADRTKSVLPPTKITTDPFDRWCFQWLFCNLLHSHFQYLCRVLAYILHVLSLALHLAYSTGSFSEFCIMFVVPESETKLMEMEQLARVEAQMMRSRTRSLCQNGKM